MIFRIFGGGKCRPRWGVQRGLPLALLGNFQRYGVLRLGKFPNKLWYFLRKYPAACRPSARLPFGGGCPCRLLIRITPPYFFPFGRWVAGRSFPFSKALLHGAVGCKVRGKNTTRRMRVEIVPLTAQPPDLEADGKPRACFAFVNGNDCSAFLRSGNSPFPSV